MIKNNKKSESQVMFISEQDDVAKRLSELLQDYLAKSLSPLEGTPAEQYLGVAEASKYLSCNPRRIYDLHSERKLRCVKDGSRLLTRASWIDAYLSEVS